MDYWDFKGQYCQDCDQGPCQCDYEPTEEENARLDEENARWAEVHDLRGSEEIQDEHYLIGSS